MRHLEKCENSSCFDLVVTRAGTEFPEQSMRSEVENSSKLNIRVGSAESQPGEKLDTPNRGWGRAKETTMQEPWLGQGGICLQKAMFGEKTNMDMLS